MLSFTYLKRERTILKREPSLILLKRSTYILVLSKALDENDRDLRLFQERFAHVRTEVLPPLGEPRESSMLLRQTS